MAAIVHLSEFSWPPEQDMALFATSLPVVSHCIGWVCLVVFIFHEGKRGREHLPTSLLSDFSSFFVGTLQRLCCISRLLLV